MFDAMQNLANLADPSNAFIIEDNCIIGTKINLAGDIDIPEGITSIGKDAFSSQAITRVHFPSTLKTIGDSAFAHCSDLTGISFADNAQITTIMDKAFYECGSLVSIELPETVNYLGSYAFAYCAFSLLKARIIPEVVIPKNAYVYEACFSCTNIDILRIQSINVISGAFAGSRVFRVFWESEARNIPSSAFENCPQLCEFNFVESANLKYIDARAFALCKNLYSIAIPEGVTHIRQEAFYYSGLQYFKAPTTLKAIGKNAFANTPCLEVDLNDADLERVGDLAFANTQITELTIRGHIEALNVNIVSSCKQLACLRIGKNVRYFFGNQTNSMHLKTARFDFAIIVEGSQTRCNKGVIAHLIFIPKDTDEANRREDIKTSLEPPEMIEGMENAYGRYIKSAGTIIYY